MEFIDRKYLDSDIESSDQDMDEESNKNSDSELQSMSNIGSESETDSESEMELESNSENDSDSESNEEDSMDEDDGFEGGGKEMEKIKKDSYKDIEDIEDIKVFNIDNGIYYLKKVDSINNPNNINDEIEHIKETIEAYYEEKIIIREDCINISEFDIDIDTTNITSSVIETKFVNINDNMEKYFNSITDSDYLYELYQVTHFPFIYRFIETSEETCKNNDITKKGYFIKYLFLYFDYFTKAKASSPDFDKLKSTVNDILDELVIIYRKIMTSNQPPITKRSTLDAFIQNKDFVTKMKQQAGVLYWYQLQKTTQ